MLDPASLSALAAAAVAALTPLFNKALEKGAEEMGKSAAVGLLDRFKARLQHPGAQAALEDLSQAPQDGDNQADLRKQLKKALETDPTLAKDLAAWVKEAETQAGVQQSATVSGDGNIVNFVVGSNNQIQN